MYPPRRTRPINYFIKIFPPPIQTGCPIAGFSLQLEQSIKLFCDRIVNFAGQSLSFCFSKISRNIGFAVWYFCLNDWRRQKFSINNYCQPITDMLTCNFSKLLYPSFSEGNSYPRFFGNVVDNMRRFNCRSI